MCLYDAWGRKNSALEVRAGCAPYSIRSERGVFKGSQNPKKRIERVKVTQPHQHIKLAPPGYRPGKRSLLFGAGRSRHSYSGNPWPPSRGHSNLNESVEETEKYQGKGRKGWTRGSDDGKGLRFNQRNAFAGKGGSNNPRWLKSVM